MSIRLATERDADALALLRWGLKAEDGDPGEGKDAFLERYKSTLSPDDPSVRRWIADRDGFAIGTVTLRLARKELSPGRTAHDIGYLTNFFVVPQHRCAGKGAALLSALIDWARSNSVELIIVWPSERSRPLYRRTGFSGRSDPWVLEL